MDQQKKEAPTESRKGPQKTRKMSRSGREVALGPSGRSTINTTRTTVKVEMVEVVCRPTFQVPC